MIRLTGEYRWEMCKRIQGIRWNDITDRSLTSEYFDYVQFYKKNNELTAEGKERIKLSLQRAKNSFKEMFIRDYTLWILFEGIGSPRLNKVARKIIFTYCPLPENLCEKYKQNPIYSEIIHQHEIRKKQRLHHLKGVRQKLLSSNAQIPEELNQEDFFATL